MRLILQSLFDSLNGAIRASLRLSIREKPQSEHLSRHLHFGILSSVNVHPPRCGAFRVSGKAREITTMRRTSNVVKRTLLIRFRLSKRALCRTEPESPRVVKTLDSQPAPRCALIAPTSRTRSNRTFSRGFRRPAVRLRNCQTDSRTVANCR
jgi:hypothetical protein